MNDRTGADLLAACLNRGWIPRGAVNDPIIPARPTCQEHVEVPGTGMFRRCRETAVYDRGGFVRCAACDRDHVRALALCSSGEPLPRTRI